MNIVVKSIVALPFCASVMNVNAQSSERPNIVLFMVDDMGWQDTSLPFWKEKTDLNRIYETPNMERLARQGKMFTSAYACSVSSPSRASLFTGMNAARHRITNWTLHRNQAVDPSHPLLEYPQWNVNGVSPVPGVERATYALPLSQILKDNGYFTVHCGKAHYGALDTPGADPLNMGFDVNIAGHACGGPGSYLAEENYGNKLINGKKNIWGVPGLEKYHGTDVFLTEALTREAIAALNARDKQKPFFLYMAHYAVHVPFAKDKRFYQKYIDKGLGEKEALYAALVEGMDKSLGDLMDYLEKEKLADNTIILFMSDNGGLSAHGRGGKLHTHNRPLNSGKGSAYEGGVREPMIVSWPGVVKPGTRCDDYLMIEDFYPTILEMAGIDMPKTPQTIDGVSFMPLLTGKGNNPSDNRAIYWNFPNNWGPSGPGIGATCSIRKGDWKLIYYYGDGHKELFNVRKDIGEKRNLAAQEPAVTQTLSVQLGEYLRSVGAQRPIFKATGKPAAWPDECNDYKELSFSDRVSAVKPENIFRDPQYYQWCSSVIKGEDGKYHLFYSRWERSYTFYAWLTHSSVAHAVADRPEGPYRYVNTVIDLHQKHYKAGDMITAHNPKIKYFNGKYYLYFCSTYLDRDISDKELIATARTGYSHKNWQPLRVNQRTFVASSDRLDGEFKIDETPLLQPDGPIETLVVNPAITQGTDGRFYLIVKGDKPGSTKFERNQALAISDYPDKGFKIQDKPVIQDWDTEDMSVWCDKEHSMYYAFFHAHTYIGMMVSSNGLDWRKALDFKIMKKRIPLSDGGFLLPDRMERPFVFFEEDEPRVLSVAVKKGEDAYIVFVPLK